MIDEIDYFPRRDRHNKKKKTDSGWRDLKKQKSEQDAKVQYEKQESGQKPPPSKKKSPEKK